MNTHIIWKLFIGLIFLAAVWWMDTLVTSDEEPAGHPKPETTSVECIDVPPRPFDVKHNNGMVCGDRQFEVEGERFIHLALYCVSEAGSFDINIDDMEPALYDSLIAPMVQAVHVRAERLGIEWRVYGR